MMKRRVTRDVKPQEMLQMRSEGSNNKQIAHQCGCSVPTVVKYIGKQPASLRARPGTYSAAVKDVDHSGITNPEKPPLLKLVTQTTVYASKHHSYTLYSNGMVNIATKEEALQFDSKQLEVYIAELLDVLTMISKDEHHSTVHE